MNKITDLITDALQTDDYNLKINMILAGLMSEEANDNPEKERQCREYLQEIAKFCEKYDGEKTEYVNFIYVTIKKFLCSN